MGGREGWREVLLAGLADQPAVGAALAHAQAYPRTPACQCAHHGRGGGASHTGRSACNASSATSADRELSGSPPCLSDECGILSLLGGATALGHSHCCCAQTVRDHPLPGAAE